MLNATTIRGIVLASLAFLSSAALTSAVESQEFSQLRVGQRIRVAYDAQSTPMRISGYLAGGTPDTLEVAFFTGSAVTQVPTRSIRLLEVHRGILNPLAQRTLVGAGAGVVAFGALYLVLEFASGCWGSCSDSPSDDLLEFASAGAILGAMTGAAYGAYVVALHPWQRVRLPAPAFAADRQGRIGLVARVPS
jgi:hypothetical protein